MNVTTFTEEVLVIIGSVLTSAIRAIRFTGEVTTGLMDGSLMGGSLGDCSLKGRGVATLGCGRREQVDQTTERHINPYPRADVLIK